MTECDGSGRSGRSAWAELPEWLFPLAGHAILRPMTSRAATVIVPTTADRGELLQLSVGSVLRQTVDDIEVFIVGDGLHPVGAALARALEAEDERVRFFDFAKGVRRGEDHRHELLTTEANGEIVCYLTDRDLWLPNHVSELHRVLQDGDFAHTLRFGVGPEESIDVIWRSDLTAPSVRARHHELSILVPLSFAGHSLDAYRRLPHGWRTTPEGIPTDLYMWQQFLDQPWCRVVASTEPTVLYFKRGEHPGLSSPERLELLRFWEARTAAPDFDAWLHRQILAALVEDRAAVVEQIARGWQNRLRRRVPTAVTSAAARVVPSPLVADLRARLDGSRLA